MGKKPEMKVQTTKFAFSPIMSTFMSFEEAKSMVSYQTCLT